MDAISITTVPWRIDKFAQVLQSLIIQDYIEPFKIIITISTKNFSNWREQFSKESVEVIDKNNIEVIEQAEDYTTFKRFVPLTLGYNILIADDDIIHAKNWLKQFQLTAKQYPNDILVNTPMAHFTNFMRKTIFSSMYSLEQKRELVGQIDNTARLAMNMGVYIPTNVLNAEFFNFELATQICDTDDESWLFAHILHSNANIRYCLQSTRYFNVYPSNDYQSQALCNSEDVFKRSARFMQLASRYNAVYKFINTINT